MQTLRDGNYVGQKERGWVLCMFIYLCILKNKATDETNVNSS